MTSQQKLEALIAELEAIIADTKAKLASWGECDH